MVPDNQCPSRYALILIGTLSARHVYTTCLNEGSRIVRTRFASFTGTGLPLCGYSILAIRAEATTVSPAHDEQ